MLINTAQPPLAPLPACMNSDLSITLILPHMPSMADAAELVARHQMLARLLEACRQRRDVARYEHGVDIGAVDQKPCTTSALVTRNVMGVSAGTRMHCGVKEYCWPIARTVTEPSGSTALPRLLSMNSPRQMQRAAGRRSRRGLRHGRLVNAGEGRHADQQADDHDRQRRPSPLDAGGDALSPMP